MFLISDVELPWRAVIPIEFCRLHFGARDVPEAASFTPDSSFLFIMTSENLHVYRILLPDEGIPSAHFVRSKRLWYLPKGIVTAGPFTFPELSSYLGDKIYLAVIATPLGASLTWFYSNGTAPQSPAALALKLIDTELDSAPPSSPPSHEGSPFISATSSPQESPRTKETPQLKFFSDEPVLIYPGNQVIALAFAAATNFLAVATAEGHVLIYDLAGLKTEGRSHEFVPRLVYVEMLATRITSLIFSPSCDELVAGCWDGTVHSFRVKHEGDIELESNPKFRDFYFKKRPDMQRIEMQQLPGKSLGFNGGVLLAFDGMSEELLHTTGANDTLVRSTLGYSPVTTMQIRLRNLDKERCKANYFKGLAAFPNGLVVTMDMRRSLTGRILSPHAGSLLLVFSSLVGEVLIQPPYQGRPPSLQYLLHSPSPADKSGLDRDPATSSLKTPREDEPGESKSNELEEESNLIDVPLPFSISNKVPFETRGVVSPARLYLPRHSASIRLSPFSLSFFSPSQSLLPTPSSRAVSTPATISVFEFKSNSWKMIKLKREIIDHGFDASGNLFVAKVDDDNHEWGRENDRRDDDGDTQSVSGGHKEVSISLMNVETLAVMATLCFEVSEALVAIFPDQHRVNHFGLLLLDGDGILLFSLVKVNDGDKKGEHPIPTPIPGLSLMSLPMHTLSFGRRKEKSNPSLLSGKDTSPGKSPSDLLDPSTALSRPNSSSFSM